MSGRQRQPGTASPQSQDLRALHVYLTPDPSPLAPLPGGEGKIEQKRCQPFLNNSTAGAHMDSATTVASDAPVVVRADAGVIATLTLNRPRQFNALSLELLEALQAALDAVADDRSVRVVVIAANGKAF